MLADKDRIFTNVYGFQPWNIDAAIMRGDWDNTRPGRDHRRDEGVGPTRPWRCGFSNRHQMVVHAEGAEAGPAELPRHQRR
jgi:hypothetical protein